jgi:diguanylate cyclase (GGDEF)-like protein
LLKLRITGIDQMSKIRNAQFKVLIYGNSPDDRWLKHDFLQQRTDRDFNFVRANQPNEIKSSFEDGTVDLMLLNVDKVEAKTSMYWLKQIIEKHLAPIIVLTEPGYEDMTMQLLQQGAVGYLPKNELTTNQLIDAIDSAKKKWKEILRDLAHQAELEKLANIDALTGILNRRATLRILKESLIRARRYEEKFCVLILDIDRLKEINDTHGHKAGDVTLSKVAALLKRRLRDVDIVGRYGGDEFLIIMPHTGLNDVIHPAERIRKAIEMLRMKDSKGSSYSLTSSIGIAAYETSDDCVSIVNRADSKLYEAKQNGRNRVQR